MKIEKKYFGKTKNGMGAELYTLKNNFGMSVLLTNFGASVVAINVPDKKGKMDDIILGYDSLEGYENDTVFFGCTVGRYANRIGHGKFTLDGKEYNLTINNGINCLHGGSGFNKNIWKTETVETKESVAVKFSCTSPDGENGFPGNLACSVQYILNNENELIIEFFGETDQATPINLTNHAYFNLKGEGNDSILDHILMINADEYTPIDENSLPFGENKPVAGSPMDFRKAHTIGRDIAQTGNGFDHNYVLNKTGSELSLAAVLYEPKSGRQMEVFTTQPGIQFYSANYLNGEFAGKKDHAYPSRSGLCLETQHFPDSPNRPDFPSTIIRPGEKYREKAVLRFSVNE